MTCHENMEIADLLGHFVPYTPKKKTAEYPDIYDFMYNPPLAYSFFLIKKGGYNHECEKYVLKGKKYCVGDGIIAIGSDYVGLLGCIVEIRDKDKETENTTVDIYCDFCPPVLQEKVIELEKRFTELYGETKTIKYIVLNGVIMSPEMIQLIPF